MWERNAAGFAVFAVMLATIGLYGVVAYAVVQARRDIAIRMALGASRGTVIALFMRSGTRLVAAGIGAGLLPPGHSRD